MKKIDLEDNLDDWEVKHVEILSNRCIFYYKNGDQKGVIKYNKDMTDREKSTASKFFLKSFIRTITENYE